MKCILLIVGLFTILALAQAQEEEAASSSSEQSEESNSEAEIPAEPEQIEESEDHQPENEHPGGKPPKRTKVWGFGINFHSGK